MHRATLPAQRDPPPKRWSDAELVTHCRAGEDAAWSELVERFARYVYAIAVQGFRLSDADAEDVFQEVFSRTYEHLPELREGGAIRPWIAQLTRRLAIDRLRASGRVVPSEEPTVDHSPGEDLAARLDEALTLHQAMDHLPDNCREILERFFTRDESYRTISAALDVPSGTIASRISRCLVKLRAELAETDLR